MTMVGWGIETVESHVVPRGTVAASVFDVGVTDFTCCRYRCLRHCGGRRRRGCRCRKDAAVDAADSSATAATVGRGASWCPGFHLGRAITEGNGDTSFVRLRVPPSTQWKAAETLAPQARN